MNYYFDNEVWGRGYSSVPYWYPSPRKLSVNQKYLNHLIKRLSIESSEYWAIITGINNSVDEIIAWSGLINKLKNIQNLKSNKKFMKNNNDLFAKKSFNLNKIIYKTLKNEI